MVDISEYLPKWFNDRSQLNKILIVAAGVICVCIALLMFAKSFPGKVKFLDSIVNKLFPPSGDSGVRKGCKDETALNYDEDAEEGDDTLCKFEDEDKSGNKNNDEEQPSTLFHSNSCNYCGIDWCTNYELEAPNILQNNKYLNSGKTLQERGCDGVTSAWRSVRDSETFEVYAVTPWPKRSYTEMTGPLVHIGSGGCVGGNQRVPEESCDANPMCTTIGRQFNGCWHILSGNSPSHADREKYAWGLFRRTNSGYESIL